MRQTKEVSSTTNTHRKGLTKSTRVYEKNERNLALILYPYRRIHATIQNLIQKIIQKNLKKLAKTREKGKIWKSIS